MRYYTATLTEQDKQIILRVLNWMPADMKRQAIDRGTIADNLYSISKVKIKNDKT